MLNYLIKNVFFFKFMLDEFEFMANELQASYILWQQELQSKRS